MFDLFLYIFRLCPLVILPFSLKNMFGSMSIYPLKILNVEIISHRERLYASVGRSRERKLKLRCTVKALLSPWRRSPWTFQRRWFDREGGLFTKSSDKDIFGSFSVLLSHILRNEHTILQRKIHKFDTVFISNHTKINMQSCVAK